MRYIDADALKEKLQSLAYDDWKQGVQTFWADAFNEFSDMVEEMPTIEPNHIEYTESEMKILELMFRIIEETIKMQNGYMDIDYVSFDSGDLYNLANKLGVEDY